MSENDFDLGVITERLNKGDERHTANINHLAQIDVTLKQLVEAITLVKGGVRMLYAVGIVSAAMGAAISGGFQWIVGHIK